MKTEQVKLASGQVVADCTLYKETLREQYNAKTDYRIFVRGMDEETRKVEYALFNSYATFEAADNARYALNKDERKFSFVCPGDADPNSGGLATRREQRDAIRADIAQDRREDR
jgi:hypothetical protein